MPALQMGSCRPPPASAFSHLGAWPWRAFNHSALELTPSHLSANHPSPHPSLSRDANSSSHRALQPWARLTAKRPFQSLSGPSRRSSMLQRSSLPSIGLRGAATSTKALISRSAADHI
jgi:hypothetical protein